MIFFIDDFCGYRNFIIDEGLVWIRHRGDTQWG